MQSVACPQCGGETWDNRAKKNSDPDWVTSPDFVCKEKQSCGWRGDWNAQTQTFVAREKAPPRAPGGPRGAPSGRRPPSDPGRFRPPVPYKRYVALYTKCAEDMAKIWGPDTDPSVLASAIATLFIQSANCAEMRPAAPATPAPAAGPPAGGPPVARPAPVAAAPAPKSRQDFGAIPEALEGEGDDLPF